MREDVGREQSATAGLDFADPTGFGDGEDHDLDAEEEAALHDIEELVFQRGCVFVSAPYYSGMYLPPYLAPSALDITDDCFTYVPTRLFFEDGRFLRVIETLLARGQVQQIVTGVGRGVYLVTHTEKERQMATTSEDTYLPKPFAERPEGEVVKVGFVAPSPPPDASSKYTAAEVAERKANKKARQLQAKGGGAGKEEKGDGGMKERDATDVNLDINLAEQHSDDCESPPGEGEEGQ